MSKFTMKRVHQIFADCLLDQSRLEEIRADKNYDTGFKHHQELCSAHHLYFGESVVGNHRVLFDGTMMDSYREEIGDFLLSLPLSFRCVDPNPVQFDLGPDESSERKIVEETIRCFNELLRQNGEFHIRGMYLHQDYRWAESPEDVDRLFQLGHALNMINVPIPEYHWGMFPHGMPLVQIIVPAITSEEVETLDTYPTKEGLKESVEKLVSLVDALPDDNI